jgi:hypothetical protein
MGAILDASFACFSSPDPMTILSPFMSRDMRPNVKDVTTHTFCEKKAETHFRRRLRKNRPHMRLTLLGESVE